MEEDLIKRIEKLEFYQELLLRLVNSSGKSFTRLIITQKLSREEVKEFHQLCDDLSIKLEEQKAEGFVYFLPLFKEFTQRLNKKLEAKATVFACLEEKLHVELMSELKKYLPSH